MSPEQIAKEAFKAAWKQVWGEAAILIVAIIGLLCFCVIVWLYFEYITNRPRR